MSIQKLARNMRLSTTRSTWSTPANGLAHPCQSGPATFTQKSKGHHPVINTELSVLPYWSLAVNPKAQDVSALHNVVNLSTLNTMPTLKGLLLNTSGVQTL
eukprot:Blabericola_migrator_1__3102@NODE_1900_length_3590_cov_37_992052_g1216_i0_p4_GENE_NODE_1900_length_3590_cov_37_992052_g1216_i0NODE_1900_length_3590_cov_37_992052_g1216_i0_p4_ORF_typecomplete_len101_score11_36_NODE_1900_length_3590_cov_37_992052_g1216_i014281730